MKSGWNQVALNQSPGISIKKKMLPARSKFDAEKFFKMISKTMRDITMKEELIILGIINRIGFKESAKNGITAK